MWTIKFWEEILTVVFSNLKISVEKSVSNTYQKSRKTGNAYKHNFECCVAYKAIMQFIWNVMDMRNGNAKITNPLVKMSTC